jgi:hypothetical protein
VQRLQQALEELRALSDLLGVPPPEGSHWHQLLVHKLVPQLAAEPWLVVAVAGGTNIGKSVIFNHLAGEHASGVSPMAAGTRHPVCLVPERFADEQLLARLFGGFELHSWQSAADPLDDGPVHRLYWRASRCTPPRLLLLDTPDIDSDARVNWERAEQISQAADVLIAVLTQQKYNDAAVKQFFRRAASADKPAIVVFNQCDLDDDAPFWPQWFDTFRGETGVDALLVYVVPRNRTAAEQLRLPFYSVGRDGRQPPDNPSALREELARQQFDEIKLRTLRGALVRLLDEKQGAPAYLRRIEQQACEFEGFSQVLSAREMARVDWPALPHSTVVHEVRSWWDAHRSAWSRKVHGFYRQVGQGITWPLRKAYAWAKPEPADPLESFHHAEWKVIVNAVERMLEELRRLADLGNETLRPRLQALLAGRAREELLKGVKSVHDALPHVSDDYRVFLRSELDGWAQRNPRVVNVLRSLDQVAAAARPAITVALFVSGWMVAGGLVHDAAVQVAGHTAANLAAEAAITGGITGGGEVLVSSTSEGVQQAAARFFHRLQEHYAKQRAAWLAQRLDEQLLGPLLHDLQRGAAAAQSEAFQKAAESLAVLNKYCTP